MAEANYAEVDGYRAVALPYVSPGVRMVLVLPPEGSLAGAAAKFDAALVDSLLSKLQSAFVTLSVPKWTFDQNASSSRRCVP